MDLNNPKTILVVQIGKIGDMVLSTPLFSELKRLFPNSSLIVLASEINKDIPQNHNSVDKVIVFRKNIFKNTPLFKLLFKKIDIWIDTKNNFSKTGNLLLKLFSPKFSMGFLFPENIVDFSIFLNEYVSGKHAVDLNISPINYFENTKRESIILPSINIPSEVSERLNDVFNLKNGIEILINVSAGKSSRYISKEKWVEFLNKFSSNNSQYFYITGIEADIEIINFILNNTLNIKTKYIPAKSILETAEIVRRSDLIITPDTAVVHLCSAFNKPIVAVYPDVNWNFEKFRPLSEFNEAIISKSENSIDVSPGEIFNAVKTILNKMNSGNAESRTRVRKEDH